MGCRGDLSITIYPKPYSIYLRGTISPEVDNKVTYSEPLRGLATCLVRVCQPYANAVDADLAFWGIWSPG